MEPVCRGKIYKETRFPNLITAQKKEGEKYVLTLPCADLHVAIINCLTAFSRRDTSDPATLAILVIFLPYQIAINVIYAE